VGKVIYCTFVLINGCNSMWGVHRYIIHVGVLWFLGGYGVDEVSVALF